MRTYLPGFFVVTALASASRAAAAQPAPGDDDGAAPSDSPSMPTRRPAALDAAFGTPPPAGRSDLTTGDNPGYTDVPSKRVEDKTYGSTAHSRGLDGSDVAGLEILDGGLDPGDPGYTDEIPDVHVVQRGDTLWDISSYYLGDPHAWPKLWSWNEHITNAHWIFPGDRVRLYDPYRSRRVDDPGTGPNLRYTKTRAPDGATGETFALSQTAFVDAAQFDTAMRVIGGAEANVMMATLDTAYLGYDRAHPPIPGERLVVYAPQEKVYDIKERKVIGYIVQIMGEVEIESIARNAVESTIVLAHNPVERGYRVGPLRRQFRRIERVAAERSASGLVVATLNDAGPIPLKKARARKSLLGEHVLVGETQFVVVNLGSNDGIEVGNVLEVVRKGDEYTKKRVFKIPYEDGWPRRVTGELVVVQTQATTSLCATSYARREVERGDHVELRGKSAGSTAVRDETESDRRKARRDTSASGQFDIGDGSMNDEPGVGSKRRR